MVRAGEKVCLQRDCVCLWWVNPTHNVAYCCRTVALCTIITFLTAFAAGSILSFLVVSPTSLIHADQCQIISLSWEMCICKAYTCGKPYEKSTAFSFVKVRCTP